MGLFIGKIQEAKMQDRKAFERQVEFLEGDFCPDYFTDLHKKSMGLTRRHLEDEEEIKFDDEDDSDDEDA